MLLLAGTVALIPATASAAPKVKLKASEAKEGPYVNAPGESPLVVTTSGEEPKDVFLKASLASKGSAKFRLFERVGSGPGGNDYDFRWSKGRNDITHDAQTSGHLFKLVHGKPQVFRLRMTPEVPGPDPACAFPRLGPKDGGLDQLAEAFIAINNPNACE
jgi:hypothetical protein